MRDLVGRMLPAEHTVTGYVVRLSRPRFWFYLAGPAVVGIVYAATTPETLFRPIAIGLFLYFLLPANVFLYGINDIFDADIDATNPKKGDREVRYRRDRLVPFLVVISGGLGVALVPLLPRSAAIGMGAFLLLSIGYSTPPLRFKTTPFLDSISNGLYVLPGVVTYATVAGTLPPIAAIAGGWLWTMGMHTFSAIPDIEPDRTAGIETTATLLGERVTYAYCGLSWLAAAIVFGTVHPFFGIVLGIYPAFVSVVATTDLPVDRAYWWFPAINTAVGALLTIGGLWVMIRGR